MNRRRLRGWLGVAVSAVLLGCGGEAGRQAVSQQSLADVRAQVQAYERVWSSHDAGRVAAFFAQDADMIVGNGPRVIGREAIEAWWAQYFSGISDSRGGTFEVESLQLLAPDVALANVNSLTEGRDEDGEALPVRRARGTWVLTAQDGQWLIAALRALPAEGDERVAPGRDRR